MMAAMVTPEKGATVLDPACGSGRILLSALKSQREIEVFGCDVDNRCVSMATINLFLNGATGYTFRMNSLSMEVWSGYRFGIKYGLPYLIELSAEDCKKVLTRPKLKQIKESLTPEQMTYLKENKGQLPLF